MADTILQGSHFFETAKLEIRVLKRDPELPYPLHGHDFYELVVVVSGTGIAFTSQDAYPLSAGSLFAVPVGFEHGYRDVRNLVLYNVLLSREIIERGAYDLLQMPSFSSLFFPQGNRIRLFHLSPPHLSETVAYLDAIRKEGETYLKNLGSNAMTYALWVECIVNLCRTLMQKDSVGGESGKRLQKILDFLDHNLDRPISRRELMERSNMASSTLNRYFKQETGLSPIEYHIQKRIGKACDLIHDTDLTMDAIAEQTGFLDANYFSRQFKKIMKMSPTQYRKAWKSWDFPSEETLGK